MVVGAKVLNVLKGFFPKENVTFDVQLGVWSKKEKKEIFQWVWQSNRVLP